MPDQTLSILLLTVKCAALTTLVVMIPGTLLAYLLARYEFIGKYLLSTLSNLPLVLPPTAVGYLLLQIFASEGILGRRTLGFDLDVILTWKAVVIACSVMTFPLVVRTARVSFESVNPRFESMARTLGYGPIKVFFFYTLPLAYRGLAASLILGFTRALGEFGATVTLAGNIPGKTQTIASAIFSAQQAGNDREAYALLFLALVFGFVAIFVSEHLSQNRAPFLR